MAGALETAKRYARQGRERAGKTLRDMLLVPAALEKAKQLPDILSAAAGERPLDAALLRPAERWTLADFQAALANQAGKARARVRRTLADLLE